MASKSIERSSTILQIIQDAARNQRQALLQKEHAVKEAEEKLQIAKTTYADELENMRNICDYLNAHAPDIYPDWYKELAVPAKA